MDELHEGRDGDRDLAEIKVKNGCDTLAARGGSRAKIPYFAGFSRPDCSKTL